MIEHLETIASVKNECPDTQYDAGRMCHVPARCQRCWKAGDVTVVSWEIRTGCVRAPDKYHRRVILCSQCAAEDPRVVLWLLSQEVR